MDTDQKDFDEKLRLSALLGEGRGNDSADESSGASADEWVDSQAAIAELLGVTVKTINRWLKKPKNPGRDAEERYNVPMWRKFAAEVGRKAPEKTDKAAAELEGILLKNERARLDYEKECGNLLSALEVAELLAGMGNAFANRLAGSRYALGPKLAGLSVPEITKRVGVEHHNALAELAIPAWAKKKVGPPGMFWSKVSRILSGLLRTASPGDGPSSMSLSPAAP